MIGIQVLSASTPVGLVRAVALATTTLVRTVALVRTVDLRGAITLSATVIACSYKTAILTRGTVVPGQSKGIVPSTALGIFDFNDSGDSISRLRGEVLMTTSTDSSELKVWRI
jgi:hypothetical protein